MLTEISDGQREKLLKEDYIPDLCICISLVETMLRSNFPDSLDSEESAHNA